jgi:hypothetical protein
MWPDEFFGGGLATDRQFYFGKIERIAFEHRLAECRRLAAMAFARMVAGERLDRIGGSRIAGRASLLVSRAVHETSAFGRAKSVGARSPPGTESRAAGGADGNGAPLHMCAIRCLPDHIHASMACDNVVLEGEFVTDFMWLRAFASLERANSPCIWARVCQRGT